MNPKELQEFINKPYNQSNARSKFINEFQYDDILSNSKSAVYYNPITTEANITHRGTNGTVSDWQNNLAYALGV